MEKTGGGHENDDFDEPKQEDAGPGAAPGIGTSMIPVRITSE